MIAYELDKKLYLNITNRCTNDCSFCIRNLGPGVGGYNLWLDREPTPREVIDAIGDPTEYEEIVFCGYGEPMIRLDLILEVAGYIKKFGVPVRIDTNGHANLIHGVNVPPKLKGLIDTISISLNAENAAKYQKICRPKYGEKTFESIIEFAKECTKYVPNVILSVVEIPGIDIERCRRIAGEIGARLRVRAYVK